MKSAPASRKRWCRAERDLRMEAAVGRGEAGGGSSSRSSARSAAALEGEASTESNGMGGGGSGGDTDGLDGAPNGATSRSGRRTDDGASISVAIAAGGMEVGVGASSMISSGWSTPGSNATGPVIMGFAKGSWTDEPLSMSRMRMRAAGAITPESGSGRKS